jgi:hypothetical protein
MTIRKRIEALAGGQVAVLVIVGVIATYMLWQQAESASRWAAISRFDAIGGRAGSAEAVKAYDYDETTFRITSITFAAATAFLVYTWFGRKRQ